MGDQRQRLEFGRSLITDSLRAKIEGVEAGIPKAVGPPAARRRGVRREPGPTEKFLVSVIMELNLDEGEEKSSAQLKKLLQTLRHDEIEINLTKEDYANTEHYLFVKLTPDQIQKIENARTHPEVGKRLKESLRRIWPDETVTSQLNVTRQTVAADRAHCEFFPSSAATSTGTPGKDICWAVLDGGIAEDHPHFNNDSLKYYYEAGRPTFEKNGHYPDSTVIFTKSYLDSGIENKSTHGTHVAGIIAGQNNGAFWEDEFHESEWIEEKVKVAPGDSRLANGAFCGIAPWAKIIDLVVLDTPDNQELDITGQSSKVIMALRDIRKMNADAGKTIIHGANLSLGAPFNVKDYGCGHTPLCDEVNRLVESGVAVVVAAGNEGYKVLRYTEEDLTKDWESHHDISLCDPANADLAITVGSTHRKHPLRYGVSYFSSRGPTADGRVKPDILAPGEKVLSANGGRDSRIVQYVRKSGTSQAAPHVSGAIACFLSCYPELRDKPTLVKKYLLETGWNINREPYFQGHGVLDLYRFMEIRRS